MKRAIWFWTALGLIFAGSWLWTSHNNSAQNLRHLAQNAVALKQTKTQFLAAVSKDSGIDVAKENTPEDQVVAFADVPLRIFSTNVMVVVWFKDGAADHYTFEECVAAM